MPNVDELQTANRDLLTLLLQFNAVSELMSRAAIPVDKGKVLESIAVGVRGELSFDRVGVWRFDRVTQSFIGEAASGISNELVRSLRFPLFACLPMVRQALNEGRSLKQDHAVLAPLLEALYEGLGEPVQPAIAVPLLSRGKDRCWRVRRIPDGCAKAEAGLERGHAVSLSEEHVHGSCLPCGVFPVEGFLWADNARSERPLYEDLFPLGLYLRQADLMLENALLYEELSNVTIQDTLTGVSNRSHFNHLVQVETERSLRYEQNAAVVFLDVHGLRRINETAGQAVGDRLLSVLAEILKSSLRRIDFVARYGGDEFALLLPHTDSERALRVASRLIRIVSEHEFHLPESLMPVRLSAGISVVPENAADADTLLALADYALHEAREMGPGSIIRIGDPKPTEAQ
jgi:diguanylate cyclase (GGDEF)-like protein